MYGHDKIGIHKDTKLSMTKTYLIERNMIKWS